MLTPRRSGGVRRAARPVSPGRQPKDRPSRGGVGRPRSKSPIRFRAARAKMRSRRCGQLVDSRVVAGFPAGATRIPAVLRPGTSMTHDVGNVRRKPSVCRSETCLRSVPCSPETVMSSRPRAPELLPVSGGRCADHGFSNPLPWHPPAGPVAGSVRAGGRGSVPSAVKSWSPSSVRASATGRRASPRLDPASRRKQAPNGVNQRRMHPNYMS